MVSRPAGVHDIFAGGERVCSSCGAGSARAGRSCPACGAPYVARRIKLLGTVRRRVTFAAATLALLLAVIICVVLLTPGINGAKRAHETARERADAAARAALIATATAQQRLQLATGRIRVPGLASPRSARLAARAGLVGELELAITRDARARVRAGIFSGPVLFTTCGPYPADSTPAQAALRTRIGAYSCLVVNRPVKSAGRTVGELGDPFWARIDFTTSRFAWCKINPRPGEQAIGAGSPEVPLAPACDLSRPAPQPLP